MSTPLRVHVFPTCGVFLSDTKTLAGSLPQLLVSRFLSSTPSSFLERRGLGGGRQVAGIATRGGVLTWRAPLDSSPAWRSREQLATWTMASKRQHAEVAHSNGSPPPKRSLRHDKGGGAPGAAGGGSPARRGEQGQGKHKEGSRAASLRKADAATQSPKTKSLTTEKDWLFGPDRGSDDLPDAPFMDSVVKVYCVHTEPNFSLPWQKRRQYSSTGSGFMTSGRRLLTNAHCVEHHTQVKVKRRGDDTKFVATVLAIGTECDIALLTVEDPAFWEGPTPLKFGTLPRLQDAVTVVGYPIGGDTISVTSGVVSRIEVTSYVHGSSELLGVQIDAAINAGNSGGPAFNDRGQCVGIAFQSLKSPDAENIGYIIPTPVIFHFLNDYERNGRYTGFPSIGITWQKMESPALRASVGLQAGQKGVLVRRVEPTSQAHGVLLPGDVLMSFDGVPIANDGTVPFRSGERISFGFLVSQKFAGETSDLSVLRERREQVVRVGMKVQKRLIPVHIDGRLPSYYICAGLVFTPVVQPFLESEYGSDFEFETPVNLLYKMFHVMAQHDEEQVVALSQVLANEVNIGYEDATNTQVVKVNGAPVRNLRHLAHLADTCQEPFLRFDLENADVVVLDLAAARAATQEILQDHCIPSDRSDDLRRPYKDRPEDRPPGEEEPPSNGALALAAIEAPLDGNVA